MESGSPFEIRILIVEDDSLVAHDMKEILEEEGFEVIIALNPEKALSLLQTRFFDLAILDINLGHDISGIDIASKMQEKLTVLPFIFLTAYSDKKTLEKVKSTIPAGFIAKPFHKAQLLSTIFMALSEAQHEAPEQREVMVSENQTKEDMFSVREWEIIEMAILGWPNKKIASQIFVSVNTVKFHLKNIFEKLDIHHRAELWQKVKGRNQGTE